MKILLASLIFFVICGPVHGQEDELKTKVLPKEKMLEDFNYLRNILEKTHPALYRYSPKEAMQSRMDSIAALFSKDMPFYDYYLILASLIAEIRCAHTYIIPKQDLSGYVGSQIRLLSYELIPIGERMYITASGTRDTLVHSGDELLEIDGRTIGEIRKQIFRYLWSDGYIESSKVALTYGNLFGIYYYMMVARPDTFHLKIRNQYGEVKEVSVPAIKNADYMSNAFKNPVNKEIIAAYKEKNKKDQKHGWRLEILGEPSTALLRINAFGGGKNEEEAVQKMRKFMDKNMATLKKNNINNLIVDLRNNGGGWDIQGVELFTYLMKDTVPLYYFKRQHSIIDSSSEFLKFSDLSEEDRRNVNNELVPESDGTFTVKVDHTPELTLQHAKSNHYTGKIYFLVNGASGSTTSEFAALAYSNKLGLFIGDETGGAYEGDNGGSFLHFQLPNTGISVGTPLLYYDNAVTKPKQPGRGVIPDHYVPLTKEDLLAAKDTQLEFTLELIRKNK